MLRKFKVKSCGCVNNTIKYITLTDMLVRCELYLADKDIDPLLRSKLLIKYESFPWEDAAAEKERYREIVPRPKESADWGA